MIRWFAGVILLGAIAGPVFAEPTLRWSPASPSVRPGEATTLSIFLDDVLSVRTFEVFVDYDPALVTTVSGAPGALFSGFGLFQGFEEVDPGIPGLWHGYCVILGATQWATGPGELFRWTVRGDAEGICGITVNEVTLLPPGGGGYPGTTLTPTALTVHDYLSAAPLSVAGDIRMVVQPNPFNPRTMIRFDLPIAGAVQLAVFDLAGRLVRVLAGEQMSPGGHEVPWDGRDDSGREVGSGTYLARLEFGGKVQTIRMGLVR